MKVIDLLNKIANNEIKNNCKFKKDDYEYQINIAGFETRIKCACGNDFEDEYNIFSILNHKIEIIEEEKKIELPEKINELVYWNNEDVLNRINSVITNQNQIIDYLKNK